MEEPHFAESMKEEVRKKILEMAYSTIILYLANNVFREINEQEIAYKVWTRVPLLNQKNIEQNLFERKFI